MCFGNKFYETGFKSIFFEGYLGVSFFFILSGFILSLNYKNKLGENTITFKEFWVARIAKIYPLHLLTLLIAIPLCLNDFLSNSLAWFGKLITNLFLLQSFVPNDKIFFSFNLPSWSLSDEMFFYLLFPIIITIYYKFSKTTFLSLILLLIIPIGIFLVPDKFEHAIFYINPFFRIGDFIIGMLLYNLYEQKIFGKWLKSKLSATLLEFASVGLFITFVGFHAYIPNGYRYSCYYWIPMIIIILIFSYQSGYLSDLLSNRILVLLGEISFGIYLIHNLAINYITFYNTKLSLIDNPYILSIVILIVTIIASYISYKFFELPINKYIKVKYKQIRAVN
jgi:peptidoglycan/LPS O-acetylase OafA/YrhL